MNTQFYINKEVGWSLTGNNISGRGSSFIGTLDAADFVLKANAVEGLRLTNNGIATGVYINSLSAPGIHPVYADTMGALSPHINPVTYTQGAPKANYSNPLPYVIHGDNTVMGSGGLTISNPIVAGDSIILTSRGLYKSLTGAAPATATGNLDFAGVTLANTGTMVPPISSGSNYNLFELDIRLTFFQNSGLNVSCMGTIKFIDPGTSNPPLVYTILNLGQNITLTSLTPEFFISWSVNNANVGTTALATNVQHLRY